MAQVSADHGACLTAGVQSLRAWNVLRRIPVQEVCKFLAGAFFVSAGTLSYLWAAGVSVPLLGTRFIETPELSGARSIVHAVLFVVTFYLGFVRTWKVRSTRS